MFFFGVVGLAGFREMRAAQEARGLGPLRSLAEAGDLRRFYLPVWGRMLVWFITAATSGTLTVLALR